MFSATGCAASERNSVPQFSVHRNKNTRSKGDIPYLLNVQSDLLDHLDTRVVVPLAKVKSFAGPPSESLKPMVTVGGERHILLTPLLAGISKNDLGPEVDNLRAKNFEIVRALDVLITGV